jgi:hypothetical protein
VSEIRSSLPTATALEPTAKADGRGGESSTKAELSSEHQTASIMDLPFDRLDQPVRTNQLSAVVGDPQSLSLAQVGRSVRRKEA